MSHCCSGRCPIVANRFEDHFRWTWCETSSTRPWRGRRSSFQDLKILKSNRAVYLINEKSKVFKKYRYKQQPFSLKRNTETKKIYTDRGFPCDPPPFLEKKGFTEVVVVDLGENRLHFLDRTLKVVLTDFQSKLRINLIHSYFKSQQKVKKST